ncbi:MAG: TraM recognition site of TraD and TraG [Candidatus Omnitrophica bacterium ADurb.Bin277]|nr:MAG: TraM recognition site of TraD and TraG [Candidatus Omnitrophica bacterium ADurb.Bin277]
MDFLNKSRASRIAIALFHQSLGDLYFRSAPNFQQQVIENTNIKIILRQDDPVAVEKFSKIAGTRRTLIPTYQTEERLTGKGMTGTGSVREGQEFKIEPDLIRELKRGEAVVILKSPGLFTDHIKLDFYGYPEYPGKFTPLIGKQIDKVRAAKEAASKPKEEPPPSEGAMPPDAKDPHETLRDFGFKDK